MEIFYYYKFKPHPGLFEDIKSYQEILSRIHILLNIYIYSLGRFDYYFASSMSHHSHIKTKTKIKGVYGSIDHHIHLNITHEIALAAHLLHHSEDHSLPDK